MEWISSFNWRTLDILSQLNELIHSTLNSEDRQALTEIVVLTSEEMLGLRGKLAS